MSIIYIEEESYATEIGKVIKDTVNKYKYRLKRKDKNKSREEIFYQMKVFFC